MFNFYNLFIFFIITCGCFFWSSILIQTTDLYCNFNDLYTRLWLNEFFLNMYYFYWTSFWYLVVVVVITKLMFALMYVRWFTTHLILFIIFIFTYSLTICDYYGYNFIHVYTLKPEYQINSLLSNSINKYHPFIFYFTLTWVYVINSCISKYTFQGTFNSIFKKYFWIKNLTYFLPLIYSTLVLGSWWALQEGSWGGWWNWDSSEVFGLLVMLFYLHLLHKKLWSISKEGLKTWSRFFLLILIITYTLIQLNFDLVSHNFGTKINQFISSDQFFFTLLVYTMVKSLRLTYRLLKCTNVHLGLVKQKNPSWKIVLFVFLVVIVVLLSFTELVNNFIWLSLQINIINMVNITTYYTPLTLLLIYIFSTHINLLFLSVFSYLTCSLGGLYLLFVPLYSFKKTYTLHMIIYLFILITYWHINQNLINWAYITDNAFAFVNTSLVDLHTSLMKLNTSYIEITFVNLVNNQLTSSGWNFIQWSTNQQVHTFQHNLSYTITFQSLYNSLFEYIHSICVMDFISQILALLTLWWLYFLRYVRKIKLIILF